MAAHASSAGEHDHTGHHHDEGHAHRRARPSATVSALTMSVAGRLIIAGSLAAVLWVLVLWAMG
ncbi:hypothetical protein ACJ4V0_13485 [Phreatobacter sp. HK31-P]